MPGFRMPPRILTPSDFLTPRIVTLPELRRTLVPLCNGWTWADDAINDLWLLGAPAPESQPCECTDPRRCEHQKRVLLAAKFRDWLAQVAQRMGSEPLGQLALGKKPHATIKLRLPRR